MKKLKSLFSIKGSNDISKAHILFWVAWILLSAVLNFTIKKNFTIGLLAVRLFCVNISFFYTVYFALKLSKKGDIVNLPLRILLLLLSMGVSYATHLYYMVNIMPVTGEIDVSGINVKTIFTSFIVNYLYFFLFGLMFYFFEDLVRKREEADEVNRLRLEAETAFLRAQINPHFLLNTLNFFYASALLGKGKELADGILKLSDIMRFSLTKNSGKLINLKDELQFINSYTELNQMRFNNELAALLELPSVEEVGDAKIVPLVLVTLVENAFKHGELMDRESPLIISLSIDKTKGYLKFYTKNRKRTGPKVEGHGIGMENTISRLNAEYGNQYKLTINDGGWDYEALLEIWSPAISHNETV